MPNTFHSPQGDSANQFRLPHLLRDAVRSAGVDFEGDDAAGVTVTADDVGGIVVRTKDGAVVESIEVLQILLGVKPTWRRPVVAGHLMSDRDALVLRRVGQGRTTREIASEIGVSDRTVTTVRRRLRERNSTPEVAKGSLGVSILGAPSLTRDLVHACLAARRDDVNAPGAAHIDDRVRVLVTPTVRTLAITGGARLVVVGALPNGVTVLDAIRAGAVSHLPINTSVSALVSAVAGAIHGRVSMSSRSVQDLVDQVYVVAASGTQLSERESDVIDGIRLGESVKQTARRLGVSSKTIENRRRMMFVRFGVRSAHELERAVGPASTQRHSRMG
jgi:DNA-binding NarL/FixJ family response regulator